MSDWATVSCSSAASWPRAPSSAATSPDSSSKTPAPGGLGVAAVPLPQLVGHPHPQVQRVEDPGQLGHLAARAGDHQPERRPPLGRLRPPARRRTASECRVRSAAARRIAATTADRTTSEPGAGTAARASRAMPSRRPGARSTSATTTNDDAVSDETPPSRAAQTASGSPTARSAQVHSPRTPVVVQSLAAAPAGAVLQRRRDADQVGVGGERDGAEQRGDGALDQVQLLDDVVDAARGLGQPGQPVGGLAQHQSAQGRWPRRCRPGRGRPGRRRPDARSRRRGPVSSATDSQDVGLADEDLGEPDLAAAEAGGSLRATGDQDGVRVLRVAQDRRAPGPAVLGAGRDAAGTEGAQHPRLVEDVGVDPEALRARGSRRRRTGPGRRRRAAPSRRRRPRTAGRPR